MTLFRSEHPTGVLPTLGCRLFNGSRSRYQTQDQRLIHNSTALVTSSCQQEPLSLFVWRDSAFAARFTVVLRRASCQSPHAETLDPGAHLTELPRASPTRVVSTLCAAVA